MSFQNTSSDVEAPVSPTINNDTDSTSPINANYPTQNVSFTDPLAQYKKKDTTKVVVRFRAIGNAPILRQTLYKITASHKFQTVIMFLRKELKYKGTEPLFMYINSAFSPAPDELVSNLYKVSH
ncbi:Ubiquitin-like protein, variant 2 [Basidiobolus ranarum]|uniref:Ubiquitin-like protein ATG12 n=1 Tax=Basidiobolus ranarum TaxID=34480 RepID=A0ABR2WY28_9FUNG